MTRNELINDVVRVYFEGGDWKKYIKELVREERLNENNTYSTYSVRNSVVDDVVGIE